jgi:hypothetical protein
MALIEFFTLIDLRGFAVSMNEKIPSPRIGPVYWVFKMDKG